MIRLPVWDCFEAVNVKKGKDDGRMQGKCALKNKLVRELLYLDGDRLVSCMNGKSNQVGRRAGITGGNIGHMAGAIRQR